MKVGFIGLGNMGSGMAANLLKAGHALTVYNRTPARAEALVAERATLAKTPSTSRILVHRDSQTSAQDHPSGKRQLRET
jgi:3-hydroxyisobutyrate dehydrogenase-like beta-hydroxyacid dehydrogenase